MVKGWWLELASVVLAFLIMLCTVILLAFYNGKPLNETPQKPSLNTLVNIFSTVEAALIVYIVAEVLSQDKWHRFSSESPLTDFNIIDNASRGIRGSIQVMFKPRLGFMAVIGSLATLLAIAIGPMLQATVNFQNIYLPDEAFNATVPIARFFAPPADPQILMLDNGMKGTIMGGLNPTDKSSSTPNFGCSTGNCTYEKPYTSLAFSHECTKVPVSRQCDGLAPISSCNYSLANGFELINNVNIGVGDFNTLNASTKYDSTGKMGIVENELLTQNALVRTSIISLTNGPVCQTNGSNPACVLPQRDNATQAKLFDNGAVGAICDIALAANTYSADITNTHVTERIIAQTDSRQANRTLYYVLGENEYDPVIVPDECYIANNPYTIDQFKDAANASWQYTEIYQADANGDFTLPRNTTKIPVDCVFAMKRITYSSILYFMNANPFFLDSFASTEANNAMAGGVYEYMPNGLDAPISWVNQVYGIQPLFNNGNASFESIDAAFGRLAAAMTTYMRQNSGKANGADYTGLEDQLASMGSTAPGLLFRAHTIVVVQWYWMILPMVVLLVTCAYLTVAVVQGGVRDQDGHVQAPLWKSNALVPFVIGQNSQNLALTDALSDHGQMKALKQKKVKLVEKGNGWAFTSGHGEIDSQSPE